MHLRRPPLSVVLLPVLPLLLAACNGGGGGGAGSIAREDAPASFAATLCNLLETCGCELPYPSIDECLDENTDELELAMMAAEAAGLSYDAACMATLLDGYENGIGCKTVSELLADGTFENTEGCKVMYGSAAEGEACTAHYDAFGDSCLPGLFCAGDTCVGATNPITKALGETCAPQSDLCVDGAICTNSADAIDVFTCKDLPGLGESCMDLPQCEEGLGCDSADFTCKGPVGAGQDCSTLPCVDGHYCNDADLTCTPTLAEGDPCTSEAECGVLECAPAPDGSGEVCTPESPLICP